MWALRDTLTARLLAAWRGHNHMENNGDFTFARLDIGTGDEADLLPRPTPTANFYVSKTRVRRGNNRRLDSANLGTGQAVYNSLFLLPG